MDRSNRFLFQQAIFEGLSQRYEEELAENTENADCSQKHTLKMRKMLRSFCGDTVPRKRNLRAWVAALVAAAILLAGCTVYIFRGSVWDSIVKIYENYIEISLNQNNKGNSKPVEDIYAIGYMPEGYEFKTDRSTPGTIYRVWENAESDHISFEQYNLFTTGIRLNAEDGSTTMVECNGWEVYCRQYEDSCYYIWVDRSYYLMISVRGNVPRDEVLRIIESIELKAE